MEITDIFMSQPNGIIIYQNVNQVTNDENELGKTSNFGNGVDHLQEDKSTKFKFKVFLCNQAAEDLLGINKAMLDQTNLNSTVGPMLNV